MDSRPSPGGPVASIRPLALLKIFLIFGLLGWFVDSSYQSLTQQRVVIGGVSFLPFSPVYGIGASLLAFVIPRVAARPLLIRALAYSAVITALEFSSGVLLTEVFDARMWDYSDNFLNLMGHVDLKHSIYWAALGLLGERYLYPVVWRKILHRSSVDSGIGLEGYELRGTDLP